MRPTASSPRSSSPEPNRRFREAPAEAGGAFAPWAGRGLADILCVQEERTVGNDDTVRHQRRILQIAADRHRHHYVRCKVRVHEDPDGALAVFHGPRRLARYDADGTPIADGAPIRWGQKTAA